MIRSSALSPANRLATIVAVLAFHALVLMLVLINGSRGSLRNPLPKPMSLIEISTPVKAEVAPAPPPPPALPSKVAAEPSPPAPPTTAPVVLGAALSGGSCATLTAVSTAIIGDENAVRSIQGAPAELRSISGAVVLWNAGWSAGAKLPTDTLEPVRRVIETVLRSIDPACINEQLAGPRLVAIPTGDHSMYAVIGSGRWSWSQMLLPDDVTFPPLPAQPSLSSIPWPTSVVTVSPGDPPTRSK